VEDPARPVPVQAFTAYIGDWATGEAYAPDGKALAIANRPDAAVLWNVANPAQAMRSMVFKVTSGNFRFVEAVAFSPTGEWMAVASFNHTVIIWRLPGRA
jgi:WD40 repeat protein